MQFLLLCWFAPKFMFSQMWGGMTYAWFFTGIVAMAMAFIIAYVHTHLYEKRLKNTQHILEGNGNKGTDGRSAI